MEMSAEEVKRSNRGWLGVSVSPHCFMAAQDVEPAALAQQFLIPPDSMAVESGGIKRALADSGFGPQGVAFYMLTNSSAARG